MIERNFLQPRPKPSIMSVIRKIACWIGFWIGFLALGLLGARMMLYIIDTERAQLVAEIVKAMKQ